MNISVPQGRSSIENSVLVRDAVIELYSQPLFNAGLGIWTQARPKIANSLLKRRLKQSLRRCRGNSRNRVITAQINKADMI